MFPSSFSLGNSPGGKLGKLSKGFNLSPASSASTSFGLACSSVLGVGFFPSLQLPKMPALFQLELKSLMYFLQLFLQFRY